MRKNKFIYEKRRIFDENDIERGTHYSTKFLTPIGDVETYKIAYEPDLICIKINGEYVISSTDKKQLSEYLNYLIVEKENGGN